MPLRRASSKFKAVRDVTIDVVLVKIRPVFACFTPTIKSKNKTRLKEKVKEDDFNFLTKIRLRKICKNVLTESRIIEKLIVQKI